MSANDSAWGSYPQGFLRQLQRDLGLDGRDAAGALAKRFGTRPSDEFVKSCWQTIRDRWIIKNPTIRKSIVAELRARGLGSTELKVTSAKGEVTYLRSCRNSAALRSIVLAHLLANDTDSRIIKSPAAKQSIAKGRSQTSTAEDWSAFENMLALTLAQMDVDQYLILNLRAKKDYYVQFALQGPFGIRMETVSNNFLPEWEQLDEHDLSLLGQLGWIAPTGIKGKVGDGSPNFFRDWQLPVPYQEISELTVRTLREVLDVRHPGFLSYRAFAKDESVIILPNLGVVREVPAPRPDKKVPASAPGSREDLFAEVKEMMKKVLGLDAIVTDTDDDIPVRGERVISYVRVQKDAAVVTVFAPVIWDIGLPPDILQTINGINGSIRYARATWDGKGVVLSADVSGTSLVFDQLATAFRAVSSLGDNYAKELQERYGGRVAIGEALPPKEAPASGYL